MQLRRIPISGVRRYATKVRPENQGTQRALRHFDEFYAGVFGEQWPSVRLALLCPNKPCALPNPFLPDVGAVWQELRARGALSLRRLCMRRAQAAAGTISHEAPSLELAEPLLEAAEDAGGAEEGSFFDESSRYMPGGASSSLLSFVPSSRLVFQEEQVGEDAYQGFYRPDSQLRLPMKQWLPEGEDALFPGRLDAALFGTGDISTFPVPRRTGTPRLLNCYHLDGASLLPVLALDLQKGDDVADLCAAPGGKLLATLFSGLAGSAVACDASLSRVQRLRECLQSYLPKKQLQDVSVLQRDLLLPNSLAQHSFDKILLDVPCTNDRLSVAEDDHNWFSHQRLQERLALPQRQVALLCRGLSMLRPGGSLVYSTCSLSPMQNDGVVHMALQELWQQKGMAQYAVVDLSTAFASLPFRFFEGCRYGQLALPFLPQNVGPLYVARIERIC
ncbi:5-methylcytosine rRNA methyltransferase l(2)10685 isoform X3 [Amblyomma americanum]